MRTALIVAQAMVMGWVLVRRAARRRARSSRLRFDELVSSLTTIFSTSSPADLHREILAALRRVSDVLGIDGGTVLEFARDGRTAPAGPGEPWIDAAGFPWLTAQLRGGEVVTVADPTDFPDEAAVDRRSYLALTVRPRVAVPLVASGNVVGALVLGSVHPDRARGDALIQRARLLGEVFAHALARKQGELEAQRLRQDLAHIGRVSAMGALTASLAHELNQPLTAILSNAQAAQRLLAADAVNLGEIREILDDIVADDKRAGGIIRRLRTLLKKGTLEFGVLDLNEIAGEVASLVRHDAGARTVGMRLELAPDLPAVWGDRAQLQQVILNLVLNGLEAMQAPQAEARTLVIRTTRDGDAAVQLAVQDTGIGFDPAQREGMFRPLHTTKAEGLGMGLTIARTIVEAHGGRLDGANNTHRGATFHFTLPVSAPAPG